MYCVTVVFTNLLPFKGDFILGKSRSRREPNLGCRGADRPGWYDALPKEPCTRAVEWGGALWWWSWSARSITVNATVTHYTSSHCRLTSPTGEWLFRDAQGGLLWLAVKLHQAHSTGSRDIQNRQTLSGQPTCMYGFSVFPIGREARSDEGLLCKNNRALYEKNVCSSFWVEGQASTRCKDRDHWHPDPASDFLLLLISWLA